MARKHRARPWSMKDDRELMEFAAADLDELAAHFNRSPAVVIKRGRRLGIYLKSRPRPLSGQADAKKSSTKRTRSVRPGA
jgi:hypothetical protein